MAQEVVINGKDFESGAGDAKLAEIARQAAATGKTVVVSTPPYWQAKVIAKLHAGSSTVQLKTSDAFFENVMVRVVGNDAAKPVVDATAPKVADVTRSVKPAESAKPAESPKPPEPKPAPATVLTKAAPAKVEPTRPTLATPAAAPAAAIAVAPSSKSQPAASTAAEAAPVEAKPIALVKAEPVHVPESAKTNPAEPTPTAAAATSASSPVVATANHQAGSSLAESRQRLENQLGLGKSFDGSIKVEQLQKGDQIFVQGPARGVIRRSGAHTQVYWLEGPLNLERSEISKSEAGRYRVDEPIRNVASPTLRSLHSTPQIFTAEIPAEKTTIRSDIERHFNDSKTISERLHTEQLQYSDLIYVYRKYAIILRRTDLGFDRYWLEGPIDLNQAGVVKEGDGYRVVSDRL